jgi:hypothetical protein
VHCNCWEAARVEALDEAIRAALGPHEHERALAVATELADQRLDPTIA